MSQRTGRRGIGRWISRRARAVGRAAGTALRSLPWPGVGGRNFPGGGLLRLLLPGSTKDWDTRAGDLRLHGVVALCLGWVLRNLTEPPVIVERRKRARKGGAKWEANPKHPFIRAINSRHTVGGWEWLCSALAVDLILSGKAYAHKVRNGFGEVIGYRWLAQKDTCPCWPEDGSAYVGEFLTLIDGVEHYVPAEDVVWLRYPLADPEDERNSLSPVALQMREIVGDTAWATYAAAIADNFGVPALAVTPPRSDNTSGGFDDEFEDAQRIRIADQIREEAGGDQAGSVLVFRTAMNFQQIGFSPDKLVSEKFRGNCEARICGAFGIKPTTVGLSVGEKQRSYANNSSDEEQSQKNGLIPVQKLIAAAFTRQSLQADFGEDPEKCRVWWDWSEVQSLQEDQDALCNRTREDRRTSIISVNEARSVRGLEAVPEDWADDPRWQPSAGASTVDAGDEDPPDDQVDDEQDPDADPEADDEEDPPAREVGRKGRFPGKGRGR